MHVGQLALEPGGCFSWAFAGLLAGWLAGLIVRGRGYGCVGDILLGLVGAFVGLLIISFLPASLVGQFQTGILGFWGTLLVAFIGAFTLAALGRLISSPSRRQRQQ